jgi:hypothetical protein
MIWCDYQLTVAWTRLGILDSNVFYGDPPLKERVQIVRCAVA